MLICLQFSPRPELTKYEQDRIPRMQENAAVSKSLGVPSLVSSMTQATMNTSQNRNGKGKYSEVDEYIPDNDGEDDSDDSSEVYRKVICLLLIVLPL